MAELINDVLTVRDLSVSFPVRGKRHEWFQVLDNVSFSLKKGETIGLVGESGCGKTTLGRTIAGFQSPDTGEVLLNGNHYLTHDNHPVRKDRRKIQMIFQNPYASLNPRMTVRELLLEAVSVDRTINRKTALERIRNLLDMIGLDQTFQKKYPHEMSGGQRQRIAIARALAAEPELIIADEAVSSLDVSVAAQIINLFQDLQQSLQLTMLFISHDLSVVKYLSQNVLIMYEGKIVESGDTASIFSNPLHPYTQQLLRVIPELPDSPKDEPFFHSIEISEQTPTYTKRKNQCPYLHNCPQVGKRCSEEMPQLTKNAEKNNHYCACFNSG